MERTPEAKRSTGLADTSSTSAGVVDAGLIQLMPTRVEPAGTAEALMYVRLGRRNEATDTYFELKEPEGGYLLRFAAEVLRRLVDSEVERKTRILAEENVRLRDQVARLEQRRVVNLQLPPGYWEEEPEES